MQDRFGESGEARELLDGFGLTAPFIVMAILRAMDRKHGKLVTALPEHITAAKEHLLELKAHSMKEALAKASRKWGGVKPDRKIK